MDLLGVDDDLAHSVPTVVALAPYARSPWSRHRSLVTGDAIGPAWCSRLVSISPSLRSWAITQLARRCSVRYQAALWLGIQSLGAAAGRRVHGRPS